MDCIGAVKNNLPAAVPIIAVFNKIDINDTSELEYASKSLGVTPNRVREAVQAVGTNREKVKQYLAGN